MSRKLTRFGTPGKWYIHCERSHLDKAMGFVNSSLGEKWEKTVEIHLR
jgi:hypothetical protein